MSLEEELVELSLVYHGQREELEDLHQLVRDYDSYIKAALPYAYDSSDRVRTLKVRKAALLGEEH